MMRFRLLVGQHEEADKTRKPKRSFKSVDSESGETEVIKHYHTKKYKAGDIIETDKDLAAMFGTDKFERLDFHGAEMRKGIKMPMKSPPELKKESQMAKSSRKDSPPDLGQFHQEAIANPDEPHEEIEEEEDNNRDESNEDEAIDFDSMNVTELKQYAEEHGINIPASSRKSDMVNLLRKHSEEDDNA